MEFRKTPNKTGVFWSWVDYHPQFLGVKAKAFAKTSKGLGNFLFAFLRSLSLMKPMKSWRFGLAFFAILLTIPTACDREMRKKSVPGPNDKVYTVSLATAVEREVPDSINRNGIFIPVTRLQLQSDFTGRVQALSVEEGQTVLSGDVLLKVEDEKLPWVLERQRAELREAEAQLEFDTRLAGEGGGASFEEGPEAGFEDFDETDIAGEFEENLNEAEDQFGEAPFEEEPPFDEAPAEEEPLVDEEPVEGETPFARLARLRARARQARLAARARQRNRQQSNQTRNEILGTNNAESPEISQARGSLNQAKVDRIRAELSLTEKQMEGSTLASAIDGFVNRVYVTEGALVKPQDPLIDIVTLDPIELSLNVPKNDVGQLDKNMEATVTVPDLGGQVLNGEISFIGAELDPEQQTVEVRIRVPNSDQKIKIGMVGDAELAVKGSFHEAILVPAESIITQDQKSYVYVQDGQIAERVEVQTGSSLEGWVEVKGKIAKGDKVVYRGVNQLKGPDEFIRTSG